MRRHPIFSGKCRRLCRTFLLTAGLVCFGGMTAFADLPAEATASAAETVQQSESTENSQQIETAETVPFSETEQTDSHQTEAVAETQQSEQTGETGIVPDVSGESAAENPEEPEATIAGRESNPENRVSYQEDRRETIVVGDETFYVMNDPLHGNEGVMRLTHSGGPDAESDWDAVQKEIAAFIDRYEIRSKETDFEKEIAIIRGLIRECTYEAKIESLENYTAYSCLIGHRAQCAGYSDAFLQIAKVVMPDVPVRYIHSDLHAWNLIRLNRQWYHVDATWEDDDQSGELVNQFINLSDDQIEAIPYHHWYRNESGTPIVESAAGTELGPMTVEYYRLTGKVEPSPDPLVIELAVDGSTKMTEVRDRILHAIMRRKKAGGHIVRICIEGLGYKMHEGDVFFIMRSVRDRLKQSMRYLPQEWYEYREEGDYYLVIESGTMISILVP